MIIATCKMQLHLPGVGSLKEKRGVLKSLLARLHREFNVSAAEVDYHDVWQSAGLACVLVSTERSHAEAQLAAVVRWIEHNRPDVEIQDVLIELV